jgi:hypothetical protein
MLTGSLLSKEHRLLGRALDLRERSGHGGGFLAAAERRWRIARKNVETNSVKKIDRAAWASLMVHQMVRISF